LWDTLRSDLVGSGKLSSFFHRHPVSVNLLKFLFNSLKKDKGLERVFLMHTSSIEDKQTRWKVPGNFCHLEKHKSSLTLVNNVNVGKMDDDNNIVAIGTLISRLLTYMKT